MRPALALSILGLAALAATAAACSDDNNNGNTPTGDVTITSGASTKTTTAFAPNPYTRSLASSSGGEVTWVNVDGVVHDIESDAALWDSGDMSRNETFSFTFTTPGTYTYHYSIHPGMVGTIQIDP